MPLADDSWLLSPSAPNVMTQPNSMDSCKEGAYLIDKNYVQLCHHCQHRFTFVVRKHNCKVCGNVFCGNCSCMVHLIKRKSNYKNSKRMKTLPAVETHHHSLLQASNACSLSQKLLGVRVCNTCQDNDITTNKITSRENMEPSRCNNIASKQYSNLSTKSPNIEICEKENIGIFVSLFYVFSFN